MIVLFNWVITKVPMLIFQGVFFWGMLLPFRKKKKTPISGDQPGALVEIRPTQTLR